MKRLVFFTCLLFAFVACNKNEDEPTPTTSTKEPRFHLEGINVPSINSNHMTGKRSLVFLFFYQCPYARKELDSQPTQAVFIQDHLSIPHFSFFIFHFNRF